MALIPAGANPHVKWLREAAVALKSPAGSAYAGIGMANTCEQAADEIERLAALINNPHTIDFVEAVKSEAAHQRERWAADHDAGKADTDWFWLIGYLAGKALHSGARVEEAMRSDSVPDNDEAAQPHREKQLHHIITTAAACLNWHANKTGMSTAMRPGVE